MAKKKDTPAEYGRWGGEMGIRLIDTPKTEVKRTEKRQTSKRKSK